VDPGFFIGECAPLKNDISERRGKQSLKENMKKAVSFQGGAHPFHPPPRSAPDALSVSKPWLINSPCKTGIPVRTNSAQSEYKKFSLENQTQCG